MTNETSSVWPHSSTAKKESEHRRTTGYLRNKCDSKDRGEQQNKDESLRSFYEAYSFGVIPVMGELIAQDKWSYQYLVESIRRFPRQAELEEIMREAGFKCVAHEDLTGLSLIHI